MERRQYLLKKLRALWIGSRKAHSGEKRKRMCRLVCARPVVSYVHSESISRPLPNAPLAYRAPRNLMLKVLRGTNCRFRDYWISNKAEPGK